MCGMPDPECRMPNALPSPAYSYSYSPEEHVCRAAEKRLHDDGPACWVWAVGYGV